MAAESPRCVTRGELLRKLRRRRLDSPGKDLGEPERRRSRTRLPKVRRAGENPAAREGALPVRKGPLSVDRRVSYRVPPRSVRQVMPADAIQTLVL